MRNKNSLKNLALSKYYLFLYIFLLLGILGNAQLLCQDGKYDKEGICENCNSNCKSCSGPS
jgi:hypothetical protein